MAPPRGAAYISEGLAAIRTAACRTALAAFLASFLAVLTPVRADSADATRLRQGNCGTPHLQVRYAHQADLDRACEAWRRVAGFLLEGLALRVAAPITLSFDERVDLAFGAERIRVLGYHDRTTRSIRITSAAAEWLKEPDRLMFRQPVDAELHTSLIAHELAHAVLLDNFRVPQPGRACGEYLAYVVQLSTMEAGARERVLAGYDPGDFDSVDQITEIYHLMRPHEFGVRAYRHFAREGHAYMVELILSGRLHTDLPPM